MNALTHAASEGTALPTVISAGWVWADVDGAPQVLADHDVVVVADRIAEITPMYTGPVERKVDARGQLVLPGFINLHTHADPKLHGTTVDVRLPGRDGRLEKTSENLDDTAFLYSIFFPLGNALRDLLSEEQKAILLQLGLMGLVRGGATTIVEQCTLGAGAFAQAAVDLGARVYVGDTISSMRGMPELTSTGAIRYTENTDNPLHGVERTLRLYERYHGTGADRVRVMFAPHATDTCSPELLRAVRSEADKHGIGVMMHVAQSGPEAARIREVYDTTPVRYLADLGLLGPDFLAAHCIYTDEQDRALLRESGTTVVHCPTSFAKGGLVAPYAPFVEAGVNVGIGTDSFAVDMLVELRTAAMMAKAVNGSPWIADTRDVIKHVTVDGAAALGRPDLGRLTPGAKADLITVDLTKVHNAPVLDPLRKAVHLSNVNDIHTVMVDGNVIVSDGKFTSMNEQEVLEQAEPIFNLIWETAIRRGFITS